MRTEFLTRFDAFLDSDRSTSSKPLAVFDCDGTIITGDIGEAMFYFQIEHFLFRTSPANLWPDHPRHEELDTLYRCLTALPPEKRTRDRRFVSFAEMHLSWYFDQLAQGNTEKACSDIVRLFARFTPAEVRQVALATFKDELESPLSERTLGHRTLPRGVRYIGESVSVLGRLQSRGFDIWAISGSNKWSVEPVFERLGVPADHVIGIDLHQNDHHYTPKVISPVPVLEGKVEALRSMGLPPPAVVVSDSYYDAPLFRYATDLRILINSRNGALGDFFAVSRIERDDSWLVLDDPTIVD